MRIITIGISASIVLAVGLVAQQAETSSAVPRQVRVSNVFHPANGLAPSPVESVTLSIYREQDGGTALWSETQNVSVDPEGRYTALLGATLPDGVPADLFASGEPRWLGVRFNRPGEVEQPRVQLVSVPYALKAADAETLGGKPASAYVLAPSGGGATTDSAVASTAGSAELKKNPTTPKITSTGSMNSLTKFTDNSGDIGNSIAVDNGSSIAIAGQEAVGSGHAGQTYGFDLYVNGANPVAFIDAYGNPGTASLFLQGRGSAAYNQQLSVNSGGLFSITPQSTGLPALSIFQNGALTMGTTSPWSGAKLQLHAGTNQNLAIGGPLGLSTGVTLHSFNDAVTANEGIELRGEPIVFNVGNVGVHNPTPAYALDVTGDINLTGILRYQNSPVLRFQPSSPNIGLGSLALQNNTSGSNNTAIGYNSLFDNMGGSYNTAVGASANSSNTGGSYNTSVGGSALFNSTGSDNTAIGYAALTNNSGGSSNIAIGFNAALNVSGGNSNNIHIGSVGVSGDSGVIRIGTPGTQTSFFAAGIAGVNVSGAAVVVDASTGQLGIAASSRRYKEDIHDMGEASRGLMKLRPVTFRYKKPLPDGSKPIQYGLIAEEVAEVYPDLVVRSADGQIETVKYQVLTPMLLNEVQRQEGEISAQREQIQMLQQQISDLKAAMISVAAANEK